MAEGTGKATGKNRLVNPSTFPGVSETVWRGSEPRDTVALSHEVLRQADSGYLWGVVRMYSEDLDRSALCRCVEKLAATT
jgi:hypothetical protein